MAYIIHTGLGFYYTYLIKSFFIIDSMTFWKVNAEIVKCLEKGWIWFNCDDTSLSFGTNTWFLSNLCVIFKVLVTFSLYTTCISLRYRKFFTYLINEHQSLKKQQLYTIKIWIRQININHWRKKYTNQVLWWYRVPLVNKTNILWWAF